ncbi:agmatine deiminase family protein [bacterium]|nr:agmatine deiminase family protein [bacterium]
MHRWLSLPVAAFVAAMLSIPGAARADFAALREQVRAMPMPGFLRIPLDRERHLDSLERTGRLAELGVTRDEASVLFDDVVREAWWHEEPDLTRFSRREKGQTAPPPAPVRYAAEFEAQTRVLARWPSEFPGYEPTFYGIVENLAGEEPLTIVVKNETQKNNVLSELAGEGIPTSGVDFQIVNTNTVWMRDWGPVFIGVGAEETPSILDVTYSRYWREADDAIPPFWSSTYTMPLYQSEILQDGGNLLTDGRGTCFASTVVFDNNPGITQQQVDQFFADYLGCDQVIMPVPLANEGTGHIDMFLKVIDQTTVMVGQYEDTGDANYAVLDNVAALVAGSQSLDGVFYDVVRVPQRSGGWAKALFSVFHTYTNGLVAGDVVMVPQYNRSEDATAKAIYESLYPDRTVVLVDSENIIQSGGAVHCVTMEMQDYATDPPPPPDDDDATDDDDADDDAGDDDDASGDDDDVGVDDDAAGDDDDGAAGDDDDVSGDDDMADDDDDDEGGCGC